ncbi:hypothetical protein [Amycolatopsis sp. lyj-23]|uniref:hypothetical protein n=1 Tax=Amycolatopsis sp. lyj-23 TaxID=2789283 RepID=UPI00397DBF51
MHRGERPLEGGVEFPVAEERQIHAGSRPGFGGRVDEKFRADEEAGQGRLDQAIAVFADAARADLRIGGSWVPLRPAGP